MTSQNSLRSLAWVLKRHPEEMQNFQFVADRTRDIITVKSYLWQACVYDFSLSSNEELSDIISEVIENVTREELKEIRELIDTLED